MEQVVGIALAGGKGVRARPLTLESASYLRSKATMCFAGRPLVEWQVTALAEQGIESFYVIANGRENRYQVKDVLGYGEPLGVQVRYSRPRMDLHNTGSGEATLSGFEHWDVHGLALVFPTDSLFDFDVAAMVADHRASGALVSIATVERTAAEVADKYGVMVADSDRWVRGFVEKPPLDLIACLVPDPERVPTSAGVYLVDCDRLRELANTPALTELASRNLDWGSDLLPWLVEAGYPVRLSHIAKSSDLGNPRDYLTALSDVLGGGYPHLLKRLGPPYAGNVWIHESSLRRRDPVSWLTLADKLEAGLVRIGPNVIIGRDVEIGPGAHVEDSYIGDGVDLHPLCQLRRVACLDGVVVGSGARIIDTHIGVMARIESTSDLTTVLDGFTALGHEVTVEAGAALTGVTVYPKLTVPAEAGVPPGAGVTTAADLLAWR